MLQSIYWEDLLIKNIEIAYLSLSAGLGLSNIAVINQELIEQNISDLSLYAGDAFVSHFNKEWQIYAIKEWVLKNFIIINSLRTIFSTLCEWIDNNSQFKNKLDIELLSNDNDSFHTCIKLLRNIYSHDFTYFSQNDIIIKKKDYEEMVSRRRKKNLSLNIDFQTNYCKVNISLNDLKEWLLLNTYISNTTQYMLAQTWYDLALSIKNWNL